MSAEMAQSKSDETYYCIKCDRNHRRSSDIGCWHEQIERPELNESGWGKSKPSDAQLAAAIAFELARRDSDRSEIKYKNYSQRWTDEGFDEQVELNHRDALYSLRDEFRAVIIRRHSGHEWIAWEASTNNHVKLKSVAKGYDTLGNKFGVRR